MRLANGSSFGPTDQSNSLTQWAILLRDFALAGLVIGRLLLTDAAYYSVSHMSNVCRHRASDNPNHRLPRTPGLLSTSSGTLAVT